MVDMHLLSLLVLLLAVGAFAGVLAGLLGVGGGIVIVPALYYVLGGLGYPQVSLMHVCVATSLATIIFTSIRSVHSHHKKGAVDWDVLRGWAPWIVLGAVAGVITADYLRTKALMAIFGTIAFLVSLQLAFGNPKHQLGQQPPVGAPRAAWAMFTGFFSTLMGIGGGTFGVTILSLYGVAIHRAVATAAGFGLIISVPAVVGFIITGLNVAEKPPFTLGYVNLVAFALIVPMTVIMAPYGARLAHATNPKPLKLAFALFLALTSLNMLRKALG